MLTLWKVVKLCGVGRLVTRLTIEERMMQQTKKKMVLEHLVVHKMNTAADLKQVPVETCCVAWAFLLSALVDCTAAHNVAFWPDSMPMVLYDSVWDMSPDVSPPWTLIELTFEGPA